MVCYGIFCSGHLRKSVSNYFIGKLISNKQAADKAAGTGFVKLNP